MFIGTGTSKNIVFFKKVPLGKPRFVNIQISYTYNAEDSYNLKVN